uniref:Protein kinase domain-containing protein n=1 Tax=Macrostomum lignano TaxID=282301 RepID=A0A1I8FRC1_9PLAT
ERADRHRLRTATRAAVAVAALALLALLAVAVAGRPRLRRCAIAEPLDKAQQLNLSLVDKSRSSEARDFGSPTSQHPSLNNMSSATSLSQFDRLTTSTHWFLAVSYLHIWLSLHLTALLKPQRSASGEAGRTKAAEFRLLKSPVNAKAVPSATTKATRAELAACKRAPRVRIRAISILRLGRPERLSAQPALHQRKGRSGREEMPIRDPLLLRRGAAQKNNPADRDVVRSGLAGGHSAGGGGRRQGRREVALCPRLKGCGAASHPLAIIAQAEVWPVSKASGLANAAFGAEVAAQGRRATRPGSRRRPRAGHSERRSRSVVSVLLSLFRSESSTRRPRNTKDSATAAATGTTAACGSRGSWRLRATPTAPLSGSGKPPHSRMKLKAGALPQVPRRAAAEDPDLEPVLVRPGQARRRHEIKEDSGCIIAVEELLMAPARQPSAARRTRATQHELRPAAAPGRPEATAALARPPMSAPLRHAGSPPSRAGESPTRDAPVSKQTASMRGPRAAGQPHRSRRTGDI